MATKSKSQSTPAAISSEVGQAEKKEPIDIEAKLKLLREAGIPIIDGSSDDFGGITMVGGVQKPNPTQRKPKAALSPSVKADLDAKAKKLLAVLKPKCVKPPPKEQRFNYVIDAWLKWIGSTLYFGLTYACPGPNAISPSFETRFARMEYVGGGNFALSYMRHNDKWFRLFPSLTVDECLDAIENDWHFQVD